MKESCNFKPSQNWLQLSAIQWGGAFSLPVFLIGYFLGNQYDVITAIFELLAGNGVLLLISLAYLHVIIQYRMITVDMAKLIFGPAGIAFAGFSLFVSLFGWAVIQWQFIKNAMVNVIQPQGNFLTFVLRGSSSVTFTTVPKLLGFMMVLSVASGLLFDLPTFYRHARTKNQGKISLCLVWMVGVLGMESFGLFVAKSQTMLAVISREKLIFVCVIVLTGVLTNALNIYSAGMVMNRLFKVNAMRSMLVISTLTLMLSAVTIGAHLPLLLELMGASAEAILCITLTTVLLRGLTLHALSQQQRVSNQVIYFLTMILMILGCVSRMPFFKDILLDVAVVSVSLMLLTERVKKYEATN